MKWWVAPSPEEWPKRVALVVFAALLLAGGAFLPPKDDPLYHDFADQRTLLGTPNALNVWSNLLFLVAGTIGLAAMLRGRAVFSDPARERVLFAIVFLGSIATAAGSAWYHLRPDDWRLVADRIPMTVAFSALLAAVIEERIRTGLGVRVIIPLIALGVATVLWNYRMDDLRPYGIFQAFAAAGLLFMVLFFAGRYDRDGDYLGAVAFYVVAKLAEVADRPIYDAIGISGHTLKHLTAGVATMLIARLVVRRSSPIRSA